MTADYKERGKVHYWRGFCTPRYDLEAKLRSVEQFSFSSQFYFLAYTGLTGNLWMIIGFMVILQTGINPYEDILVIPLLLLNQAILLMVERLAVFVRHKCRIWEERSEATEKTETSSAQRGETNKVSPAEVVDTEAQPINDKRGSGEAQEISLGGFTKKLLILKSGGGILSKNATFGTNVENKTTKHYQGKEVALNNGMTMKQQLDKKESYSKLDIYYKFRE